MLRANYFNEAACYSNPATRKGVALNLLYSAQHIFRSVSKIRYIDSLSALDYGNGDLETIIKTTRHLDSPVIDATKIITCFENFFKAELLSYGYIIHRLDGRIEGKKYKFLASEQKIRPIKLSLIRDMEGLKYQKGNDYSYQSMKIITLPFSQLTKVEGYRRTFRISNSIFDILDSINNQRNNLHLLIGQGDKLSEPIIANYRKLIDVVNHRIVSKYNRLCDELSFGAEAKINEI